MTEFENRVETKLDKLDEMLNEHNVILADMRKDLNYHIRRTDLLEDSVKEAVLPIIWVRLTIKILKWLVPILGIYLAWKQLS